MIIGIIAKQVIGAALTGAAGLALLEAAKGTNIGDIAKQAAVGVTEVGIRGYKLAEQGAEMVWATANEVFTEAKVKADEDLASPTGSEAPDASTGSGAPTAAADGAVAAEVIADKTPGGFGN